MKRFLNPFMVCCVVVFFVLAMASADAQRMGRSAENPKVKQGEFPPDFELPMLELSENEAGDRVGIVSEEESFRLSWFRGRKPVCMIMSSYT